MAVTIIDKDDGAQRVVELSNIVLDGASTIKGKHRFSPRMQHVAQFSRKREERSMAHAVNLLAALP